MEKRRKNYNTTFDIDLMKALKHLAVQQDRRVNDLLEEAVSDLLKKYSKQARGHDKPLQSK